jgi:hypothetical protein
MHLERQKDTEDILGYMVCREVKVKLKPLAVQIDVKHIAGSEELHMPNC